MTLPPPLISRHRGPFVEDFLGPLPPFFGTALRHQESRVVVVGLGAGRGLRGLLKQSLGLFRLSGLRVGVGGTTAVALWQTTSGTANYRVGADSWVDFRDVCGNRVILGGTPPTCNGITETSSPTSITIATQPILLEAAAPEPAPIISVPPTITTTTLPNGIQNAAYSSTVT